MLEPLSGDSGLFAELLDAAPDATVIVDESARIVLVNRQVERVLGYPRHELVGQPVEVLVPPRFRGGHAGRRNGFLSSPGERPMHVQVDLFALHHDGHEVPVEISLSPLQTETGLLVSASIRDITERQRIQQEAVRMREELIATVSHELRTPLTSIIGYSELLADLGDDELGHRARHLVAVIQRNASRELRLVDDLLTMAFLDGDRLRIARQPMDLGSVAHRVVGDQEARAHELDVRLSADVERLPPVNGDFYRLVQVAENLVTNALKFTPAGGQVTVRVRPGADSAVLEVADTGVGVREEEIPRLFERLYRTPSAVAAHAQGAGLGLSIVQKIVEAHGGRVDVESQLGVGTTISASLPYATEAPG